MHGVLSVFKGVEALQHAVKIGLTKVEEFVDKGNSIVEANLNRISNQSSNQK